MEGIKKVAVIGGGAAGFFAALSVAEHHPTAQITLYEKSSKVLSKVKISGGGRCNVTHNCTDIPTLIQAYPRGGKQLKSIFHTFQPKDFKNRNRWSYVSHYRRRPDHH
jgi:predicted flavoprotein YhiN